MNSQNVKNKLTISSSYTSTLGMQKTPCGRREGSLERGLLGYGDMMEKMGERRLSWEARTAYRQKEGDRGARGNYHHGCMKKP